jgi:integrase
MVLTSWQRQRDLKEQPLETIDAVDVKAAAIDDIRTQALFCTHYLTAGRVGEVVELKKNNIRIFDYMGRPLMLFENMKNEKNPKRKFKDLPVIVSCQPYLCGFIQTYINMLDGDRLFNFGVRRAEQLLAPIGFNPHWIRHIRLTHLKKYYGFDTEQIFLWAGWKLPYMEDRYLEYGWHDLVKERIVQM